MEVNRDYLLIVKDYYSGDDFKEVIVNIFKKPYAVNLPTNATKDDYERIKYNAISKIKYKLRDKSPKQGKRGRKENIQ